MSFLQIIFLLLASSYLTSSIDVLLPLYVYPSAGSWDPVYSAATNNPDITIYAVINPDSGPGSTQYPNSDYITGISTLNTYSNIVTVGYVHTSYATQPYSTLTANISTYINWSQYTGANIKINGIFFDEAPSSSSETDIDYMSNASSYAYDNGIDTVIFNTGVVTTASAYYSAADLILNFENYYSNYNPNSTPQSIPSQFRDQSAIVLHNTPNSNDVYGVVSSCSANGINAVYLTDDSSYGDLNLLPTVANDCEQNSS